MATKKVRSNTTHASTSSPAPSANLPVDQPLSSIDYDDLPMPEGIEVLFDSEPPTELSTDDISSFSALEPNQQRAYLEAPPQGKALSPLAMAARTAQMVTGAAALEHSVDLQEKFLRIMIAGERYAIPLTHILQVGEFTNFTVVPNVPEWIIGVTNLRGDIVSIVDIRVMLNLEADEYEAADNFLLTQTLEGDVTACLLVEQMLGIINIEPGEIQNSNPVISDRLAPFVSGLYAHKDEILSVLNIESLLRSLDITHFRS